MLDYGSGRARAFAEHMVGYGFRDVTNYGPFSTPARPERKFSLITCFEAIKYTVLPSASLQGHGFAAIAGRLHLVLATVAAA